MGWYAAGDGEYTKRYSNGKTASVDKPAWERSAYWYLYSSKGTLQKQGKAGSLKAAKAAADKAAKGKTKRKTNPGRAGTWPRTITAKFHGGRKATYAKVGPGGKTSQTWSNARSGAWVNLRNRGSHWTLSGPFDSLVLGTKAQAIAFLKKGHFGDFVH